MLTLILTPIPLLRLLLSGITNTTIIVMLIHILMLVLVQIPIRLLLIMLVLKLMQMLIVYMNTSNVFLHVRMHIHRSIPMSMCTIQPETILSSLCLYVIKISSWYSI